MGISHSDEKTVTQHKATFIAVASILVVLCCVGIGVVWFLSVNSEEQAKQQIKELLTRRSDALTQKDLSQYVSCFSQQYQSGQYRYADLHENAARWFSEFAAIRFSFRIVDIHIQDDDMAIVENDYTFSLTDSDGETIDIAKRELLEIYREDTEWKIARALAVQ